VKNREKRREEEGERTQQQRKKEEKEKKEKGKPKTLVHLVTHSPNLAFVLQG